MRLLSFECASVGLSLVPPWALVIVPLTCDFVHYWRLEDLERLGPHREGDHPPSIRFEFDKAVSRESQSVPMPLIAFIPAQPHWVAINWCAPHGAQLNIYDVSASDPTVALYSMRLGKELQVAKLEALTNNVAEEHERTAIVEWIACGLAPSLPVDIIAHIIKLTLDTNW
jgi:hypothetical protein